MDNYGNKNWQNWHEQHPHEPAGFMQKLWEASGSYKQGYQPDEAVGLAALKSKMNQGGTAKIVRLSPARIALRVAAGAALLLVSSLLLRNYFGKAEAGFQVALSNDAVKEVSLADGSSILLNKTSELAFPKTFAGDERKVKLEGEAFFKISRDEKRPFVVETETATITVLGTSFNVRSNPESDEFEVYVETGKVKIELKNSDTPIELTAGQFVRLDRTKKKAVTGIDETGTPNAWRTGKINFKGQPIPVILMGMERLYGIKLELKTAQNSNCYQTLTLHKDKLAEAMQALKTSCPKLSFSKKAESDYVVTGVCCEQEIH